jgi:hypothetical protein
MTPDLPNDAVERLLGPDGPEVSCEQCFELLDPFVEIEVARGEDEADAAIPGMRAHLHGCPACAEDHASLRDLVAAELE